MRGLKDLTNERVKDLANKRARRAATKVFSRGTKHLLELRSSRQTRDRPQRWLREAWRNSATTTIDERVGLKYVNGAEFESVGVIKSPGGKKALGEWNRKGFHEWRVTGIYFCPQLLGF